MSRALLVSGGAVHDFGATSRAVAGIVAGMVGGSVDITEDVVAAFEAVGRGDHDLLVLNTMRRTARWAGQPGERERWALDLPASARDGFTAHLARGGGVVALHTATNSFDDWPEWQSILGARWVFGTSWHPELGPVDVEVRTDAHPVVEGVQDFSIVDEVYTDLELAPGVEPLANAAGQPVVWAQEVGGGRLVYDALGHHEASWEVPAHQQLLRQAANWARAGVSA